MSYTPSIAEGQSYYVAGRAQLRRQVTGERAQDITPFSAEFDRMLAEHAATEFEKAAADYVEMFAKGMVLSPYAGGWLRDRASRIRQGNTTKEER